MPFRLVFDTWWYNTHRLLRRLTMSKAIDLSKSVFEICKEYPEVVDIMKNLGFDSITSPGMLQTAGRIMTIPKGAAMKKISVEKIRDVFAAHGFELKE